MITLTNVSKTYSLSKDQTVPAVRGVSLEIHKGDFTVIVGRSGSGKTTLLNLAAGLTQPTSGTVQLEGVDVWALGDREQSKLRSQKIGFVFQFPSLLPSLTVLDNILLPNTFKLNGGRTRAAEQAAAARALELLEQVGLSEKRSAFPRQLSAGQQQRVVIARALINQPELLLADEPTSNLDEQTEMEIMDLFRGLHAQLGITVVMVTHTRQLLTFGNRAVEMAAGQIVAS